ncbi:hypothetical protein BDF20DRAFT_875407 [Mycotypha africana]|uniref:uncharacterized protein n=1 Tax=Mycotypha africana TaxID=64632 RepID=UPI00230089BC|nr:uncharacterized protein BDF20DRAFT_875407 [Mycotypha africana]KAI8977539.1 hypothetical protein BDF20DRAFT_875407 [Mycotypha africana]
MIRLIQYCTRVYERFQVMPVVLVFVVVKFSSKEFEKKFVPKVNTPYLLKTSSAKSIENHIKVGMNQLVALAYYTTCQSASLSLLEYAGDSTVRFLYSICKANMKKKGGGELVKIIDRSTEQIKKAIGLDEDPILTAEKCKGFAENLLKTIEVQKRKLVGVYELNAEASQKQQKKNTVQKTLNSLKAVLNQANQKNGRKSMMKEKPKDSLFLIPRQIPSKVHTIIAKSVKKLENNI